MAEWRQNGSTARADFCEANLDEIAVEYGPSLKMVYFDVLLHGWDGWTGWNEPKLQAARDREPNIHLAYVLTQMYLIKNQADYDDFRDALPLAMGVLIDVSYTAEVRLRATRLAERLAELAIDPDLLTYCVSAMAATDNRFQQELFSRVATFTKAYAYTRREVWRQYLEHPNDFVRTFAVSEVGETIRKPRAGEDARTDDAALAEQIRLIAETDPSADVRRSARAQIRFYDSSDTRPTHQYLGPNPRPLNPN